MQSRMNWFGLHVSIVAHVASLRERERERETWTEEDKDLERERGSE